MTGANNNDHHDISRRNLMKGAAAAAGTLSLATATLASPTADAELRRLWEALKAAFKGFEPSKRFHAYSLSRGAPSTTRPPLHRKAYP